MRDDEPGPTGPHPIELRSYRAVFELEYRIYRVQRWSLPLANGIALSTICWTMGAAVAMLLLRAAPLLGSALGALPDPLRYVALPAAFGVAMSRYRPDGRPLHRFIAAALRHRGSARCVDAFLASPAAEREERFVEAICICAGPSEQRYRSGCLGGPAVVALRGQAQIRGRPHGVELVAAGGQLRARPRWLTLGAGETLRVIGR